MRIKLFFGVNNDDIIKSHCYHQYATTIIIINDISKFDSFNERICNFAKVLVVDVNTFNYDMRS